MPGRRLTNFDSDGAAGGLRAGGAGRRAVYARVRVIFTRTRFDAPTSRLTGRADARDAAAAADPGGRQRGHGVLNSRNQFVLTALSVASHNIALIAGILAAQLFTGSASTARPWAWLAAGILQS